MGITHWEGQINFYFSTQTNLKLYLYLRAYGNQKIAENSFNLYREKTSLALLMELNYIVFLLRLETHLIWRVLTNSWFLIIAHLYLFIAIVISRNERGVASRSRWMSRSLYENNIGSKKNYNLYQPSGTAEVTKFDGGFKKSRRSIRETQNCFITADNCVNKMRNNAIS